MSRLIEWVIRAWAIIQVACAGLWVLVAMGVPGILQINRVVPFRYLDFGPLHGLLTGPIFGANFTGDAAADKIFELGSDLTDVQSYNDAAGRAAERGETLLLGDVGLGWHVQVTALTSAQGLLWLGLHAVPLLVMAWVWWNLASVVRDSRATSPFSIANAKRLSSAGLVILVGSPLVSILFWILYRWALSSTQLADAMAVPSYGFAALPWTAMAAGAALLILGRVWLRGARMEHDVAGLV